MRLTEKLEPYKFQWFVHTARNEIDKVLFFPLIALSHRFIASRLSERLYLIGARNPERMYEGNQNIYRHHVGKEEPEITNKPLQPVNIDLKQSARELSTDSVKQQCYTCCRITFSLCVYIELCQLNKSGQAWYGWYHRRTWQRVQSPPQFKNPNEKHIPTKYCIKWYS